MSVVTVIVHPRRSASTAAAASWQHYLEFVAEQRPDLGTVETLDADFRACARLVRRKIVRVLLP